MLRRNSPVTQVLTYATFFAISLAIHMVVILRDDGHESAARPAPTQPQGGRR